MKLASVSFSKERKTFNRMLGILLKHDRKLIVTEAIEQPIVSEVGGGERRL